MLRALGEYVEGDGMCWVGIPSLAADCDLSQDTVRRRLAWLEEIGAIDRT
ncbi:MULTISPECIES: helix-turn-helix domain-containing protein [Bradyrhizobium]|nr:MULTISPECIES: helix-turn-helix domain-containing protein [Bradyrhizobium]MCS3447354.1 DeoR/GlpR family transcriptional regulator of sugar metabolism [Bradyrhizobium elkanii]MCS3561509.1 DeoR/GlpR family transcriptional regulator of sugar metabolism [Bradyrhizobium elkanii]MCW2148649.1 DeoR/GlpR family transcriptional regulator of sugar metabolism [Bradyrhizobium elkanii]MCW2352264.1 DeoR/GlpR family transcriptional regulator of sugar metabolism [Bradyrhizobium elkanii]MCW2372378.1 DeoR/GlpR